MRVTRGGERGERELVHAASSVGERYASASATCSGSTPSEPASAATVRATRATRARPRPESGSRSTALPEELVGRRRPSQRRAVEPGTSGRDALAHRRGGLRRPRCQLLGPRPWHGDDEVEPIEERPRELVAERRQPLRRARALGGGIATPGAGAEVHRRDQLESGREQRQPLDAGDRHDAVLERLAKRLERGPLELRQLVQQKHASMGEARLPRPRSGSAADDRGRRRAVMRCPERPPRDQRPLGREHTGDRMDPHHLERLARLERGQDRGQPASEHRLARSGRAGE